MPVTNPVYPVNIVIEAYIGSPLAWVDITADWAGDLTSEWGIHGATEIDRIADTGELRFALNNATGKYSPHHTSAVAGWGKGTLVTLYVTYDGLSYSRFYGAVESIDIDTGAYGRRFVSVTVVDWMDYAAEFPLDGVTLLTNKTADQAITSLIGNLPRAPLETSYDVGETTYPVVFDTLDGKTRAYKELAKIALSEMGYIYLRHNQAGYERLVFENAAHRNGLSALSEFPHGATTAGNILLETGDALLAENGNNLVLDGDMQNAVFDNSMMGLDVTYGQDIFNTVKMRVYPKRTDTSAQVLFSLNSPMLLAPSGVPQTFSVSFKDPTGGNARVTGINMIAPVATTDYQMFANEDGTGTDLTANLVVSVVYEADGATYTVSNNSATTSGYITLLQARGYGIYAFNPIEYMVENTASQQANGEIEQVIDQKYQTTLDKAMPAGNVVLDRYKEPRTVVNSATFNANSSDYLMMAFLNLDVGDLIHLKESQSATDCWYWIQSVKFVIKPGGVIYFTWGLKEHFSLASGGLKLAVFEPLLVNSPTEPKSGLNYSNQPRLSGLPRRTITFWVKRIAHPENVGGHYALVFGLNSRNHGIWCTGFAKPGFTVYKAVAAGWDSDTSLADQYVWNFISISHDFIDALDASPVMYLNSVLTTCTQNPSFPGTGSVNSEDGVSLVLGNRVWDSSDYVAQFPGQLKDIRIYNRVLTQAEITAMYNAGAGCAGAENGLIFQGPCVYASREADYGGANITANDMLIDNVYGAVGTPMIPTNIKVTVI